MVNLFNIVIEFLSSVIGRLWLLWVVISFVCV